VEQGEGSAHLDVWDGDRQMFDPIQDEVGHYFRFQEIRIGRRYRPGDTQASGPTGDAIRVDPDGVRPMQPNPSTRDHPPGAPIRVAQERFNRTYCTLLQQLESAFNGRPRGLSASVRTMFELKAQARALMELPTGNGHEVAGPSFEYVAPGDRTPS
jgi:hypothetical protein